MKIARYILILPFLVLGILAVLAFEILRGVQEILEEQVCWRLRGLYQWTMRLRNNFVLYGKFTGKKL